MKKLILLSFSFVSIVLLILFLPAFIPQIEITINIEANSKSVVQAQKPDNSDPVEELACHISLDHTNQLSSMNKAMNEFYLREYHFKGLSIMPIGGGTGRIYWVVCKD